MGTSIYMDIALRRCLHTMAISRQKEARSRDYVLLLFRIASRALYSAQYHGQHSTLHAFEQFEALYMHNHDDKYPPRPGLEPGTPRLQAPVDTNEPSGPASGDFWNLKSEDRSLKFQFRMAAKKLIREIPINLS